MTNQPLLDGYDAAMKRVSELFAETEALRAENAKLRKELRDPEWKPTPYAYLAHECPWIAKMIRGSKQ